MDTGIGFVSPLFFIGVVENREDPRAEGRVQVRAFGVHGSNRDVPTQDLPWATLIIGNHDVNFTPPPLNAWVFGFFIDGRDAQQPMILGLIPSQSLEIIDPSITGWGAIPSEDYDRQMQGSRARDIGTSPLSNLATGEFLNETYNTPLELNRALSIPIAGGTARRYAPGGNGNSWTTDPGETADSASSNTSRRPIPASELERISELDNDAEFQRELSNLQDRYGVTREQVYGIIAGESSYNPSVINNFGYAGFFQMGNSALTDINARNGTNYTPSSIAAMSPAQQLVVYGQYLDRWNYRNSSGLGIMQAAPAFASRPGNAVVYEQGSLAWQRNPAWRGSDGRITVDSINAYYNRRNPPANAGDISADAATPIDGDVNSSLETERQEVTTERISAITTRIVAIDDELSVLSTNGTLTPEEIQARTQELLDERNTLEEELQTLQPNGNTPENSTYVGYMSTSSPQTVSVTTWEEPSSAYGARYPYNRVIETAAGHSIELDDTPGAERIMIWHTNGSYVQISNASTTHKNMGETYAIHERNNHVYIKGSNLITIDGDCHTLIKGDKVEEIQGDYRQIVHGSIMMGAARSVEINGANRTDIRSASLSLDSNVENLNIRTLQNIVFESGNSINFQSRNIRISASEIMSISGDAGLFLGSNHSTHIRSTGNIFITPSENIFMNAEGGSISAQAAGSFRVNSDTFISLNATSTIDLQAEDNLILSSDASVNINSDGLIALSSESMYLNSGGGNLNLFSGSELRMQSSSDMNISGDNLVIGASSDLDIRSGGITSLESTGVLNLLSSANALLTGADVHLRGSTVYVDDIIQLSSGGALTAGGAISALGAEVKERIEAAPYTGEGNIAAGGDFAGSGDAPMTNTSPSRGPAPPPILSIPPADLIA